ncbi:hypothetical protein ACW7G0_10965 [Lysobacter sp. A286]
MAAKSLVQNIANGRAVAIFVSATCPTILSSTYLELRRDGTYLVITNTQSTENIKSALASVARLTAAVEAYTANPSREAETALEVAERAFQPTELRSLTNALVDVSGADRRVIDMDIDGVSVQHIIAHRSQTTAYSAGAKAVKTEVAGAAPRDAVTITRMQSQRDVQFVDGSAALMKQGPSTNSIAPGQRVLVQQRAPKTFFLMNPSTSYDDRSTAEIG